MDVKLKCTICEKAVITAIHRKVINNELLYICPTCTEVLQNKAIMKITHDLKIYKEYFEPVLDGSKTFEIRKNDRNFRVGDRIVLNELQDDKKTYTGRYSKGVITYVTDYAQKDGYVVFSFRKADWEG